MEIVRDNPEIKKKTNDELIESMFSSLLSKGHITKEVVIGDLKIVMKPLSTSEILQADSIYVASVSSVPQDVISRVRIVSNLTHAIVSLNDLAVPDDNVDKDGAAAMRSKIHEMLMKLPPAVIDHLSMKYRQMVEEQTKVYEDLGAKIENF